MKITPLSIVERRQVFPLLIITTILLLMFQKTKKNEYELSNATAHIFVFVQV